MKHAGQGAVTAIGQVSQAWAHTLRITLYPGMFSFGGISPGVYTGVRGNDVVIGISFSRLPVGLALSR